MACHCETAPGTVWLCCLAGRCGAECPLTASPEADAKRDLPPLGLEDFIAWHQRNFGVGGVCGALDCPMCVSEADGDEYAGLL